MKKLGRIIFSCAVTAVVGVVTYLVVLELIK
jgi:hypothetical protein